MRNIKYLIILIPLLFVIIQCKKEKPEFQHPEVTTGTYNPENGTAVGTIKHLSDYVKEYGHMWGTITPTIDSFLDKSTHTEVILHDSIEIISNIPDFPDEGNYFIRAYVVDIFDNPWYGDIVIQYSPSDFVKACFTSSHTECEIHECGVRFDATCSEGAVTYKWDFNGDNVFDYISDTPIADYRYPVVGTYYPRLYIVNDRDIADDTIFTIQVFETEQTLIPCFLASDNLAVVGTTIDFDASCSQNAVYYEWDFDGDGLLDYFGAEAITGSYTYDTPGDFTAKLTVTNDDGITATDSIHIKINPLPLITPTACFFASITEAEAGTEIEFYGSCSEDALIYRWDFDEDEEGDFDMGGIGMETVTHIFDTEGVYDVRLEVASVDNITDEFILTITINPPTLVIPTACIDPQPPANILTNEIIYFDASCSENAVNYKWNFGDGTILNGSQEVVSHAYDEVGNYEVTLTTRSIDGEEAEFTTSAIQCDATPPDEYIFTPEPIENLYPVLIVADSEIAGDGPLVEIECTAFILNETQIYLDVYCRVREWPAEPGNGATEGLYENDLLIYTAPTGKKISAITSSLTSTASYIDNDLDYDIIPHGIETVIFFIGELVDRFEVLGDTSGFDISPSSICPDDDCTEFNIYFNEMTIELIDE